MASGDGHSDLAFQRFGRSYHVRIGSAEDLRQAVDLDEALWVATGAPVSSFACDAIFLKLLDSDVDGRVMCDELREAVLWTMRILSDRSDVSAGLDRLRLYAVDTSDPDGHRIVSSARKMLRRLPDGGDQDVITLDQVRGIKAHVEAQPISEAGVVLPSATADRDVRAMLEAIVACTGGAKHPGGERGVGQAQLDAFTGEARRALEWHRRGQLPDGASMSDVLPLGEATAKAYEIVQALGPKLQQFFARCEAVRLDARLAERIALQEADLAGGNVDDPEAVEAFLRDAPLAPPTPEAVLRYDVPKNPYYIQLLRRLDRYVVEPVLGGPRDCLSWPQWDHIQRTLQPYADWQADRPAQPYLDIPPERLGEYLADERVDRIRRLIAESADTAFELGNIRLVEKLILFQANLVQFANAFISFPNLYDSKRPALFERGTLVIDGRRLTLAVDVPDRKEHIRRAEAAHMFVLYIVAIQGERRREFCLPVTDGGRGNIVAGKRGVFIDRDGGVWDARVVHVVENPVSLGEALLAPFRRIAALVSGKIDSRTAEAADKLDATTMTALDPHTAAPPAATPPAQAKGGPFTGGVLMGGGVAIAALTSSIAYMAETFSGMAVLDILIGLGVVVGVAVLLVAVPTLISAKLRLRKRDLSAILEGSGWAVNARMRLTRRQCRTFTHRPPFPPGASGVASRWTRALALVLLAGFVLGLGAFLKYGKHSPLRREEAPTATAPEGDRP
ncbi:MAG: hypothetical protein GVY16_00165 [Planctomycetes bacterium]|jgi:hypothetical protein|nr:hypothetical protein [Phycisphaerae bacterium]NBB94138.1 hypothetical protein [Planctomycetota bacterium]